MAQLRILDCTLRDGGYVNDFNFGARELTEIVGMLSQSGVEIIECGFLQDHADNPDQSLFASAGDVRRVLSKRNARSMYVAMLQLGRFHVENLEPWDGTSIDGIRLTFHEHEIEEAFSVGEEIQRRGYKLFMQPVGTNTYPDDVLLQIVRRVNQMRPYAFYLVDTLGSMYKNDLMRMLLAVDHNLAEGILLGFHSHNNLQLSFSNAQQLAELTTKREILLDSSVFGMGRGAGNLCTELICQYINENIENRYSMLPILEIMDEYVNPIFRRTPWGYSAAHYLSSINGCHPNYATYFLDKQTISVRDIHAIIRSMEPERRVLFDREYAEESYIRHLQSAVDDHAALQRLREVVGGRSVLLLAPGKSLNTHRDKIRAFLESERPAAISINFLPREIPVDGAFISNLRRFRALGEESRCLEGKTLFVTSNISPEGIRAQVLNYSSYLNDDPEISDNAGLMLINALVKCGVGEVILAGFDGYLPDPRANYFTERIVSTAEDVRLKRINRAIAERVAQLRKTIAVRFLTPSIYQGDFDADDLV